MSTKISLLTDFLVRKFPQAGTRFSFSTSLSTRSIEFKFKEANSSRKRPPPRPNLRNRKTLIYMGLALLATVAAPKIINDVIAVFEEDEDADQTKP